jgi:hypothetical protein
MVGGVGSGRSWPAYRPAAEVEGRGGGRREEGGGVVACGGRSRWRGSVV